MNQVGMFVWAEIPDEFENAGKLSDLILKEASVFLTPGFIFGSQGNAYIRISLCTGESLLIEAKQRIINLFNKKN